MAKEIRITQSLEGLAGVVFDGYFDGSPPVETPNDQDYVFLPLTLKDSLPIEIQDSEGGGGPHIKVNIESPWGCLTFSAITLAVGLWKIKQLNDKRNANDPKRGVGVPWV